LLDTHEDPTSTTGADVWLDCYLHRQDPLHHSKDHFYVRDLSINYNMGTPNKGDQHSDKMHADYNKCYNPLEGTTLLHGPEKYNERAKQSTAICRGR
jgi:hypothetical protein